MTAEIAIMNKSAIALAADSKVTITNEASAKGYDSVNKLFTLSKRHPVAIMVYGNAEIMDVPWEVIIKEYRNARMDRRDTIAEYADDFVNFIQNDIPMFDEASSKENVGRLVYAICSAALSEARIVATNSEFEIGSKEFVDLMADHIDLRADEVSETDDWMQIDEFEAFEQAHRDECIRAVAGSIGALFNEDLAKACIRLAMLTLLSEKLSPRESGIVIAGYGEKEFFPSLVEYGTDGLVGNRLKVIKKGDVDVSRDQPSCIRAFAQSDMVQRFMNGCDAALFESLIYGFHDVLKAGVFSVLDSEGVWEGVSEGEKLAKSAAIETRIQKALQAFVSDCESHLDTNYSQPIIQMIGLLPKEELAGLAESLVSLTSLKRRVSAEQETVGGPIDVALISKRDGVVWIKRKHYFDAELNHHFFKNYFDASMEA